MSMFCYQCQETMKGSGCTVKGVCGKTDDVANMQDLLVFITKGVSILANEARSHDLDTISADKYVFESLFITITNANFDKGKIMEKVREGYLQRKALIKTIQDAGFKIQEGLHSSTYWIGQTNEEMEKKAESVGVMETGDVDARSLKELLTYGIKGIAAYAEHAWNLGYKDATIYAFMEKGLEATTRNDITNDELIELVMECGKFGVNVMALLDKANTETYGHPEMTQVNIGVGSNPGILISGHDLKDMDELLQQTEGTGVDVYTHSEMLPANYYPKFKKYKHFVGNYGSSWWKQKEEFDRFNGPVLLTTNCLVPPKGQYKERIYTTGAAGFEGCVHIPERKNGGSKDFSILIEHAKKCTAPEELETGSITGGFAHNQLFQLADTIVGAVKSGAIKKFFVMAGCDGRMKSRDYYTEFAKAIPEDTVILTAGCAKYRYNKLALGDIGGIPRVIDAGQCNDSYSLALTALKLKEIFELNDINKLPIAYNIAWWRVKKQIVASTSFPWC